MNDITYYNRQKVAWGDEEIEQLTNEYNRGMNIIEIADIHHRTPGSISYRLKMIGVVQHTELTKGYSEYKNSDLYKSIVEGIKTKREEKVKDKGKKEILKNNIEVVNNSSNEISELKKEIVELKKDIKEVLRLMNALYDFETQ